MSFLFWLVLIVGGGLLLLSFVGDSGDQGAELEHEAGHGGDWGRILSLRNATYFLFGFGATGVLLQILWSGRHPLLTIAIAAVTGAIAWAVSALSFSYLRRSDVGQMHGDRWLIGRTGEVTIPLRRDSTGKIVITRAGQTQELLAMPLNEDEPDPESWRSVMVVEMRDGVALVTPSPENTEGETIPE